MNVELLFLGMYDPKLWPTIAGYVKRYADILAQNSSNSTKRSLPPLLEKCQSNSSDPAPDYSLQAITCADAMDAGNTATKDVFDEMVRVTRDVSQMCK